MAKFVPGEIVVCIDDTPLPDRIIPIGMPWIRRGRSYRIADIGMNEQGEEGVRLVELQPVPPATGWYAWRFDKFEGADELFCKELRVLIKRDVLIDV